jgi:hypothetical protein
MARPTTEKKFDNLQTALAELGIEREIADATSKLRHWTNRELVDLSVRKNLPVAFPISNGIRIGLFKVKFDSDHACLVYDNHESLIQQFSSKINAVLFCVHTIKKEYIAAKRIRDLDLERQKNQIDIARLQSLLRKGSFDTETTDILFARLSFHKSKLASANEQLEKLYKLAKFKELWRQT